MRGKKMCKNEYNFKFFDTLMLHWQAKNIQTYHVFEMNIKKTGKNKQLTKKVVFNVKLFWLVFIRNLWAYIQEIKNYKNEEKCLHFKFNRKRKIIAINECFEFA